MPSARLAPLDAAFLAVETPTAHMHVGWAATFAPPAGRRPPPFPAILEHIEARLPRAPRYRQKLAPVPLGLHHPVWIDDTWFDIGRHVTHSTTDNLAEAVDECMSEPLPRDRPLWQVCVADRLADGSVGIVGKAHHCMVDGIAAVELASLMIDPVPDPDPPPPDDWTPDPEPGRIELLRRGVIDRTREELELAPIAAQIARAPGRMVGEARRAAEALADAIRPAAPSALNESTSPLRHLAFTMRPLDDLRRVKDCFEVPLNDVLLAVASGGMRRFLQQRGEPPTRLKTMVPISMRGDEESSEFGNRLSFMFIDLPCDEPDPTRRLRDIHLATSRRKESGEPRGASAVLRSLGFVPRVLQGALSRAAASPRAFNLVVSNIPGPREPLYLMGCEMREAYPVVPLADGQGVSIGMTTVCDRACFGVYADRRALPDADLLAQALDYALDELLERSVGEDLTEPAWAMP